MISYCSFTIYRLTLATSPHYSEPIFPSLCHKSFTFFLLISYSIFIFNFIIFIILYVDIYFYLYLFASPVCHGVFQCQTKDQLHKIQFKFVVNFFKRTRIKIDIDKKNKVDFT